MNPDCIFCKIVAGQVPAEKVYEDEQFVAFLDIRPLSPGHTLVIPKEHHRWVWDVPQHETYFRIARDIAHAQRAAFGTDAIHSRIVGEEVPHAHIWVYPDPETARGEKSDVVGNGAKLRVALIALQHYH